MDKLESDLENFVRLCHLHEKCAQLERTITDKEAQYQHLLDQAVRFAQRLDVYANSTILNFNDVRVFLNSPEAQAFLKEHP